MARRKVIVVRIDGDGCWIPETRRDHGYSRAHVAGFKNSAWLHVAIDRAANGPIPEGKEVHHRCQKRPCINPEHFLRLTHLEHGVLHQRKFCKRGHELTPENSYRRKDGVHHGLACRTCKREWHHQNKQKGGFRFGS